MKSIVVTTFTHDAQGNVLTETMTLTTLDGVRTLVTTYTYDDNGNETSVLDAEGNLTQYEYDGLGNQTAIIDDFGRRTINRYDQKNNLIATILPDETPEDLSDNYRTQTDYDAEGNRTAVTDFAGHTTIYSYDPLNRPTGMVYPDDTPEDLSDNPTITVDYNKAGWMTSLVDESGNTAQYEYDAVGRIIATRQTDESGNIIESKTEYDAAGQVIATTDALGRTTRYKYDKLGQVIETIFHDDTSIKTEYDAEGNEIAKTDQAGNTTYYEYDALDRLTAVIDAENGRTEYEYDEAGNLVYQKDANNHITRFKFDGVGRQTGIIRDLGQESFTIYNAVGNVISTTDFNGETITYEYNEAGLLTLKTFEDSTTVEFGYNDAGQLKTITDQRGVTTYSYNERGNLLSHTQPDGKTITYGYNDAGKLETIVTPTVTTTYTYDQFNFLDTVTANGQITDYDYDVLGNLVQTTLPNGVVETSDYDDLNRLIELTNTDGDGNVISSYDYTLDDVGNRIEVEELGGRTVAYEYDKLYRLLSEDITDPVRSDRSLVYTYDAVGNRLTLDDSIAGLTTYSYNNNDWLLSETEAGVTTNYSYDDNGNTVSKISPEEQIIYDWNQENRLIGAEISNAAGTTNLEYQYDASGVRVASIVDGVETRYLVDTNREYAQVLEEYKPDGTTEVAYVHGLSLISANRDGETDYYVNDGHSGVRLLSNETGVVTDVYDYDGYGNLISSVGDSDNNYLYRGEQFDQRLGMQYLRARYYNPGVGRFASVDPFEGLIELPVSRHRYLYANANPVSFIDPSGEISLAEVSLIGAFLSANLLAAGAVTSIYTQILFGGQDRDIQWDGLIASISQGVPLFSVSNNAFGFLQLSFGLGIEGSLLLDVNGRYISTGERGNLKQDAAFLLLGGNVGFDIDILGATATPPGFSLGGFSVETPFFFRSAFDLAGTYSLGNAGIDFTGAGYSASPFLLGIGRGSAGGTNANTNLFAINLGFSSGLSIPLFINGFEDN